MKKSILYVLTFIMFIVLITGCGKKDETKKISLNELAQKINSSETVKKYKEYGFEMNASVDADKLVISSKMGDENSSVNYKLEGNILSNDNLSDEDLMSAIIVIDSIGQLHGYKEGELSENLNAFSDEISKYTIEKEGFELKKGENINSLKIDLSKKIPLIDLSNFYLKTDEFDMIEEIVSDKSSGNQTGKISKLSYDVQVGDDESYIYIGEIDKLTDSAYKSILSALEVMYGSKVSNKFKSVYPSFKNEKTTVDEFTVETDYKMEDQDNSIFKDAKIVLVTINNEIVNK